MNRLSPDHTVLELGCGYGRLMFSSYTDSFWPYRLHWFEAQAREGLLGAIDYQHTGNGVTVCNDGFRSGRMTAPECAELCDRLGLEYVIEEVDESSLFCEIQKSN